MKANGWVSKNCKFAAADMPGFDLEKAKRLGLKPPKKDWGEYDQEQLRRGVEVEKEHTDDPAVSAIIAGAHLDEISDYYSRLDKMEEEAKSEKRSEVALEAGERGPYLSIEEVTERAKKASPDSGFGQPVPREMPK